MIRDITIGRYYDVDSVVHRLDPRFKLLTTFLYIILLFSFDSMLTLLPMTILLFAAIVLSKVKFTYILKGIKPIMYIIALTVLMNMFFTNGRVVFEFYFIDITYEGLVKAVFMGVRLLLLIMGSSLMTYTTSPIELTDAIEGLLKPFKKIGIPSHEIAMIMSMALRFIPTLMDETDKIMRAQMARGANFESKNIIKRAKSYLPILVPLFVNSFKRADDLAMAMEARCYRGDIGRTRLKTMQYGKNDLIALIVVLICLVLVYYVDNYLAKSLLWSLDISV